MIDIRPDPKRPRGGFAEITVSGATPSGGPVEVTVYNSFLEKWLGPDGWQPNRHGFPARQAEQDGDTLRLIVGPDIVNQIEEDTPLKIGVAGTEFSTYWPDDINQGPDVAIGGDLAGTGSKAAAAAPKPITSLAEPEPTPDPEAETEEDGETDAGDDEDSYVKPVDDEPKKSRAGSYAMWAVALLAVIGAAAWYFLMQPGDKVAVVEPEPTVEDEPQPEPVAETNPCGTDQLRSLASDGFKTLAQQLRTCGSKVSIDDALTFVERASAANDPDALVLFGALYDTTVKDEPIKTEIGLNLGDNAARAAEYYARAKEAGSDEATNRLTAVCRGLLLKSDTLSQSAHEDFCQ